MPFRELGLGIEGVDLRRSAIGEDVDDPLGSGRVGRLFRSHRIHGKIGSRCAINEPGLRKKSGEPNASHAHPEAMKKFASIQARLEVEMRHLVALWGIHWRRGSPSDYRGNLRRNLSLGSMDCDPSHRSAPHTAPTPQWAANPKLELKTFGRFPRGIAQPLEFPNASPPEPTLDGVRATIPYSLDPRVQEAALGGIEGQTPGADSAYAGS